jgi:Ser/Thr protein kinase RdoA (MazF antagonist)
MEKAVEIEVIKDILQRYGFYEQVVEQKAYIHAIEDNGWMKLIFRVTLENGKMLVIKILHEDDDLTAELQKVEKQSTFSEIMRSHGIETPTRYQANGYYCGEFTYHNLPCVVTMEDWCGEEITEITADTANQVGKLMARMHTISHANKCEIGHRTLFSAAYWNDVDCFPEFCEITKDEKLDQAVVAQIKALRDEKLERIRTVWETLPKAAVQGDISINNLVRGENELIVFDYNNAGDEVLISDLVMEGILTAYEMELPDGTPVSYREQIFPALLKGYLSVRQLSEAERKTAWEVYTLYHGLWFTRIVYNDDSLDSLVKKGDYEAANRLLKQMLTDMQEADDGRFKG